MKDIFKRKFSNIHANLMACHRDTQKYPSPISGAEREAVQQRLLSLVLPVSYRIGAGTIIDSTGRSAGQVDTVVERPFSVSFPVHTDTNRLYLADTVAAAFEIKSDLVAQKNEALEKCAQIRRLRRFKLEEGGRDDPIVHYDRIQIPTYIIAYTGPKKMETLEEYVKPSKEGPTGALVIESGLFVARTPGGEWIHATGIENSLLAFFSSLITALRHDSNMEFSILNYENLFKSSGLDWSE